MDQEKNTVPADEIENIEQKEQNTNDKAEKAKKKKDKKKKSPEKEELEKLQADYDNLNDNFLRLRAEYDNFRKRSQAEKVQAYSNAAADTVEKILAVSDNIDRALAQEQVTVESLVKGLEMIAGQFAKSFEELGVQTIGEKGEPFNPELHNAVAHIEDEELGENVIAAVLQKGYVLKDGKVIRHAMVQVAN